MDLIVFLILIALGYTAGTLAEKKHYRSIERREAASLRLPMVTFEEGYEKGGVRRLRMVQGSAVISVDYFKRFVAGLRMIFGGRVSAYESLLDRARREAILRMKEQAIGAEIILGMRIKTSTIGGNRKKKSLGSVEALAYGTAVWTGEVQAQTP